MARRLVGVVAPRPVVWVAFRWLALTFYWFVLSLAAEPLVPVGKWVGHDRGALEVAGVDDPFANEPCHHADLDRALGVCTAGVRRVLLAHQPINASWPRIVVGLVKLGGSHLYVPRGTGWWGPPMRFGAPNEVTGLTLQRAERAG